MKTPRIIELLTLLFCLAIMTCMVTGCAGVTEYHVTTPDGVTVDARNTKDYQSYSLNAKKEADGSYSVKLEEEGVSASDPQKVANETLSSVVTTLAGAVSK